MQAQQSSTRLLSTYFISFTGPAVIPQNLTNTGACVCGIWCEPPLQLSATPFQMCAHSLLLWFKSEPWSKNFQEAPGFIPSPKKPKCGPSTGFPLKWLTKAVLWLCGGACVLAWYTRGSGFHPNIADMGRNVAVTFCCSDKMSQQRAACRKGTVCVGVWLQKESPSLCGRNGSWWPEQGFDGSHLPWRAGRPNWKWGKAIDCQSPSSVMYFLQQGSTSYRYNLPKQPCHPGTKGAISHSNLRRGIDEFDE